MKIDQDDNEYVRARLVANGSAQKKMFSAEEKYSLVISMEVVRWLLSVTNRLGLILGKWVQADVEIRVVLVFLYSELDFDC